MNESKRVRILVSAGAFKQSLTAAEACAAIARGLDESGLGATVEQLPIADGGNGTLDAFLASGGERITIPVMDPLMRPIDAQFGLIDAGRTAVIEMALASGLELLKSGGAESAGSDYLRYRSTDGGCLGARRGADHHRLGRQRHGRWRHGLLKRAGIEAS